MSIHLGPAPNTPISPPAFEIHKDPKPSLFKKIFCLVGLHDWIFPVHTSGRYQYCYRCGVLEMNLKSVLPDGYAFLYYESPRSVRVTLEQASYYEQQHKEAFNRRIADTNRKVG
jgi:hypothetical protein